VTRASGRRGAALVAVVVAAALLAGCSGGSDEPGPAAVVVSPSGEDGPYQGVEIDPPYRLPAATLTDTDGDPMTLPDDLVAPVRLFFFGYTRCPDICPLVMSNLALAVARLPDEVAGDVQVLLVTSDPARDDPAALRAYVDRYDPDFTGLTGDLDTITSVADTMGVPLEHGERLPGGGYDVGHGSQVVGYVHDRGVVVWTSGTSAEDMADDLVRMLDSAASEAGQEG